MPPPYPPPTICKHVDQQTAIPTPNLCEWDANVAYVENNIDIDNLREPLKLFEGTAREAAKGFPANLNVAVALSLAGVGPDRTSVQIWADPTVTRNVHRIEVEADSARFSMSIENIPSENPKTGLITALSVIALLRKQRATLCVGT
ncbi:putative dinucleotide-utilizing enzyme [Bradyrhizobium japonicum]